MASLIECPWNGLKPYSENDLNSKKFCGRTETIYDLFHLVNRNICVTLYGKSGIGKTSLLRAGLFPILRKKNYFPVYVRLGEYINSDDDYAKWIIETVNANVPHSEFPPQDIASGTESILWDWFTLPSHEYNNPQTGDIVFPVLVLDQFEEILKRNVSKAQLLLKQIRALLDEKYRTTSNGTISITPDVRVIISIREDDLYLLEEIIDTNYIQNLKANRYRLTALSTENAEEIINLGCKFFENSQRDNIVSRIIEETTENNEINTILLSLYCYLLWHHTYDNAGTVPVKISSNDVLLLNGRENLIADFYEKVVGELSKEQRRKFEERLVSEGGRRLSDNIEDFQKALWNNTINENNAIEESYKRLISGEYAILREFKGKTKIELIHDKIAEVIAEKVSHRQKREQNLNRLLSMRNVLLPQGRALLDNSLDFGGERDYTDPQYPWDYFVHLVDSLYDRKDHINISYDNSTPTPFADETLSNSDIILSFESDEGNICTSDGIYKLRLTYTDEKVTKVVFLDQNNKPFYIRGGYAGIEIKYDTKNKYEIERKYIDKNGLPIRTKDGYASVQFIYDDKYGKEGFPTTTLFYDEKGMLCRHIFGNVGFQSVYNEDGFEYQRTFLACNSEQCPTIIDVYGKEIEYDEDSLLIKSIKNIDAEGKAHPDKDGYVQIMYEYDNEKQRYISETFCDGKGIPLNGKDGFATMKMIYAQDKSYEEQTYFDEKGKPVLYHGANKVYVPLDKFGRYLGLEFRDNNNQLVKEEGNIYYWRWAFDEHGKISSISYKERINGKDSIENKWLHYDESGVHIIEMGSKNNEGLAIKNKEDGWYGERILLSDAVKDSSIRVLINQSGMPYKCKEGWYAYRTWENGNEVFTMFYDPNGKPMKNSEHVYGYKIVTTPKMRIQTALNADITPMEDCDGVCYIEEYYDEEGKRMFDINHQPTAPNNGVHGNRIERHEDKVIKVYFDTEGKDLFYEISEQCAMNGEIISREWTENKFHQLEGDMIETATAKLSNGDTKIIIKTITEGKPTKAVERHYDTQERIKYQIYYDDQNNPIQEDDGSYGTIWEYDEKYHLEKQFLLDRNGEKYEYTEITYDDQHRIVKIVRRKMNEDILVDNVGDYGTAYEYGTYDNVTIKVTISLNKESSPQMNNEGYAFKYEETNSDGKLCYLKYLDLDKKPIMLPDGSYGYRYEYENNIKKEICVDQDGKICENNFGYSYKEIEEREGNTKEMYFDINHQPTISLEDGCEDYGKIIGVYESSGERVTISLGKEGEPHKNHYGYTYKLRQEDVDEDGDINIIEKFFDLEKNPTIFHDDRELGNYGLRIIITKDDDGDQTRYFIGLDRNGEIQINNKGFLAERRVYDKKGRMIHSVYLDKHRESMKDEVGDYGTSIQYSEDGAFMRVWSLDKNMKRHNNRQGWACMDQLTLITGEKITMYWDISGKQVIPNTTKSIFSRIFG